MRPEWWWLLSVGSTGPRVLPWSGKRAGCVGPQVVRTRSGLWVRAARGRHAVLQLEAEAEARVVVASPSLGGICS